MMHAEADGVAGPGAFAPRLETAAIEPVGEYSVSSGVPASVPFRGRIALRST